MRASVTVLCVLWNAAWILLIPALCLAGYWFLFGPGYYRQAEEIRRLAEGIEGVEVIEVEGNHDVTLEDIRLELRVRGVPLHLGNVAPGDFDDADHLQVSRVGEWRFHETGYRQGKACLWGPFIDVGRAGEFGGFASPPFRSIPDLVARFDELRAVVERIPEEESGVRQESRDGDRRYTARFTKEREAP